MIFDSVIVGGGIAGLQAAIQLGRYGHSVLVVDKGEGRSTLCRGYHNLLGWPDGISGTELRRLGRRQAEATGVRFAKDEIWHAEKRGNAFALYGRRNVESRVDGELAGKCPDNGEIRTDRPPYMGKTLLLATGVMDRFPDLPGLVPCLGKTVYVCPDCDGYEVRNRKTVVMGAGDTGARMALALAGVAAELVYVNHERKDVAPDLERRLAEQRIAHVRESIETVLEDDDGHFHGVRLQTGREVRAERGFIAFGGNEVRTALAARLGAERHENGHVWTDPRTKMTTVPNVWAAGDIGIHSEQAAIAMGEGIQAAIWMHKALLAMHKKSDGSIR